MNRFALRKSKQTSVLSSNNQLLALLGAEPEKVKPNKYGAKKSGKHASKKEAKRSAELQLLQKLGEIHNLREQVKYELIPSQRGQDGKVIERAVTYTADFVYQRDGAQIVEDSKGFRTQQFVIRRKMMLYFHGIRVVEV